MRSHCLPEGEPDGRAALRPPLHPVVRPDPPAVARNKHPADVEPEPGPGHRLGSPNQPVEEPRLYSIRDPRPGILDRDEYLVVVLLDPDGNFDAGTAEFRRVPEQVRKDLGEEVVGEDGGRGTGVGYPGDGRTLYLTPYERVKADRLKVPYAPWICWMVLTFRTISLLFVSPIFAFLSSSASGSPSRSARRRSA